MHRLESLRLYAHVVRAFVGVTDRRWCEFLRARPELSEVNFWRPSGLGFRAISSGEPFLFKTHHPDNKLVGGGLLSDPVSLRLSEAWDIFGEANGVASLAELRAAIGHYRRAPLEVGEDPKIGCILFARSELHRHPSGGSAGLCRQRRHRQDLRPRKGQWLLHRSGVESAAVGRLGLLLRSDVHTLFDRGYLGVGPDRRIHVSPRLRSEFDNGESLYRRQGEPLTVLPARTLDRPDREALEWHMDVVFQAS